MSEWGAGEASDRANNAVNHASSSGSGIHIKKSKEGSLHTALGVPQGQKIPAQDLSVKPGDSPALVKKKTFAKNAKGWNHG